MDKCECCGFRHDPIKTDCPEDIEFDGYVDLNEQADIANGKGE